MKESRPKKIVTLAESTELDGWSGFFRKHLNTISTVVLLILAVVMFVRWRMKTSENARVLIGNDLATAQTQVNRLRTGRVSQSQAPADLIKAIEQTETQASAAISNVVNSSDADERMRAEAFVLRGDMYWYLANLPPLPGSESESSLRLSDPVDSLLQKAADSYQQVIKDSAFANQHEQINTAHLGLAAIAENHHDWAAAQKELETVRDDPNAVEVLAQQAKVDLAVLPTLKQPVYLVPPSGLATSQPTTGPVTPMGPALPPGLMIPPTTRPASSQPTTLPTTTKPAMH